MNIKLPPGEARFGVENGGTYYKIGLFRSADLYANTPSAVAAARRTQQIVTMDGEARLRPVPETVEW